MTCARRLRTILIAIAIVLPSDNATAQVGSTADLTELIARYCILPDGDTELTWALARHDGLAELAAEDFRNLRLPGARQLRGFTRTSDGVVIRVLTAHNRMRGGGAGTTRFNVCWVSASPMERGDVDRAMRHEHGMSGFRQEGARVYAWIPNPDGTRRVVSHREFQRRSHAIAREDGMRMLLTNDYLGMVAITYMVPTDDCKDWCY